MARYKAAVIGLGNIGMMYDLELQRPHPSTHVFAYEQSDAYQLVCGIDGDKDKREILKSVSLDSMFYLSLDKAIEDGAMAGIDAVSICTPPNTHLDLIIKLLIHRIGRIIFCEKPIVSNIDEIEKLKQEISNHKDVIIIPNISRRWNEGIRKVRTAIDGNMYGNLKKINIRYTRGIENTGSHLFDLLRMWTDSPIVRVQVLGVTATSASPEPSYNFYFELKNGTTGYAEAIDDNNYYMFDIDMYFTMGKIEMRNSGDDISYYTTKEHHLFNGFQELTLEHSDNGLLQDACIKNAIDNIEGVLNGTDTPFCTLEDAIYPLHIARKLRESYKNKRMEEIDYV